MENGKCGENLSWSICDGVLKIKGKGEMYDFNSCGALSAPWREYNKDIRAVMLEDGVTSLGKKAFMGCYNLVKVTIPETIVSIGEESFWYAGITGIAIPKSVMTIGCYAFYACTSLKAFVMHHTTQIGYGAFIGCTRLNAIKLVKEELYGL